MARPTRQGVDYFPMDVHLDDKFKFVEIKFGLEGFGIVIKLMQKIYSQGYWCSWTEDELILFSDEVKSNMTLVKDIVEECLQRNIFSKEMYTKYGILTSKGIQKRYKEIVKRRKNVEVITEYLLIDNMAGTESAVNDRNMNTSCKHNDNIEHTSSEHDDDKSTQSKVKESKVLNNNNMQPSDFNAAKFFDDNIARLSPLIAEKIIDWENDFSSDVIIRAMQEAVEQEKRSYKYISTILTDWRNKGVKTINDAERLIQQHHQAKNIKPFPRSRGERKVADF